MGNLSGVEHIICLYQSSFHRFADDNRRNGRGTGAFDNAASVGCEVAAGFLAGTHVGPVARRHFGSTGALIARESRARCCGCAYLRRRYFFDSDAGNEHWRSHAPCDQAAWQFIRHREKAKAPRDRRCKTRS
jgi:hypothetical protein